LNENCLRTKRIIYQLTQGKLDFASLNNVAFLKSKLSSPDLRILAAQNAMDSTTRTPWVARASMKDSLFMALRESLFNIRNSKILISLGASEFVQGHEPQYADNTGSRRNLDSKHEPLTISLRSENPSGKPGDKTMISVIQPLLLSAKYLGIRKDKYNPKAEFHEPNSF
jgi:hypothetical protein